MIHAAASSLAGGAIALMAYVLWRRRYRWVVLLVGGWSVTHFLLAVQLMVDGSVGIVDDVMWVGWVAAAAATVFGVQRMWVAPPGAEPIAYGEKLVAEHIRRDQVATDRDRAALRRDEAATDRDIEATARDRATRHRDEA